MAGGGRTRLVVIVVGAVAGLVFVFSGSGLPGTTPTTAPEAAAQPSYHCTTLHRREPSGWWLNPTAATTTVAATTIVMGASFPPGDGSCHGENVEGHRVRERCVLDRLQYIFETVIAGIHGERMSVIGDGHMLVGVLANLEAWAEEWRGGDYPPFEGLWSGFENGRRLVPGAGEYGPVEGRVAAPAVWVDGQWVVSYFAYCRVLRRMGQACLDDPRPHVASEAGVRPEGSGDCVLLDLSDAEADTIRDAPVW